MGKQSLQQCTNRTYTTRGTEKVTMKMRTANSKDHVRPLLNLDKSNGAGLLSSELLLLGPEGLTPSLVPGELCNESKDRSESTDLRTVVVKTAGEYDADAGSGADGGEGDGGVF